VDVANKVLKYHNWMVVQVHQAPGAVAAAFATVIIASLIPILRGANLKVKGAGPFNTRAEVSVERVFNV